eukprot:543598_1
MASERTNGDWMCPNCEFLILGRKKKCKKCGAKKHVASGESWSKSPAGNTSDGHKGGRKINKRYNSRVKHNKKYGKSVGDEWICSSCNCSNFADREECRNCKKARPTKIMTGSEPKDQSKPNKSNHNANIDKKIKKIKSKANKERKDRNRAKRMID